MFYAALLWQQRPTPDTTQTPSNVWTFLGAHAVVLGIIVAVLILVVGMVLFVVFRGGRVRIGKWFRFGGPKDSAKPDQKGEIAGPSPRASGEFDAGSSRLLWTQVSRLYDWVGKNSKHRRPSMKWLLVLEADYSVSTTFSYVIEAADKALPGIQLYRASGDGQAPDFLALNLMIRGKALGGNRTHIWLPAGDDAHKKRFIVLFCPPLQPGEQYQLEVQNVYPEAARKLEVLNNRDTYAVDLVDVIDGVGDFGVTLEIRVEGRFHVELPNGAEMQLPDAAGRQRVDLAVGPLPPEEITCAITRIS
jgi:hypothetical protein